ncbi:addiction module protein [Mucilaginibacter sp.]|uniref:addiction module protein n=1 Tax=Mucilaginibacter sp. TaxID=1882438 RepID=UPI0028515BD3|nr:addiction module protein [Mucilaginibacter sp.]MDR3695705.1 addiction module protein [Mucilaginibacter sp.]
MEAATINIQLNFKQIVEAVRQLSPSEKFKLNEIIWEDNIEIPKAHQELVLSRLEKGEQNPERLLDWDEVVKTL